MIRAIIFGASGYTGIELIRILSCHPEAEITAGSSRNWAGKTAREIFPFIMSGMDFPLLEMNRLLENPQAEIAFLALPHGESAAAVRPLLAAGLKVIDLSADLRINDPAVYQTWYGPHKDPEILSRAVYGLPEINRELIRKSDLIANPGCYPTTVILSTAPLVGIAEIDTSCVIADSKSGVSGAGRGAKLTTSFCEAGESFKPYGVIKHRHIPEMEQELSKMADQPIKVRFTPHLIPASRGMVSTLYFPLKGKISAEMIRERFHGFYGEEPFVKILPPGGYPDTLMVRGSNQCHIGFEIDDRTGWLIVMCAIDNLVKGASGQAVQNMNLLSGLDETSGLTGLPLFP